MITVNGKEIDWTKFPNGEIGFQINSDICANVDWTYQGDHELVQLAMIANQCFAGGLNIRYMPYSRMDRVKGDWAFTLKTVIKMINSMEWSYIDIAEPHSDVCVALFDFIYNARPYYPTALHFDQVCKDIGFIKGQDYIVFPDAGAEKRYGGMYEGQRTLVGVKSRNFETGKITAFNLYSADDSISVMSSPRKAIIIDDLCSKGGTFLATAEALRDDHMITDVTLLVAHLETAVHQGAMLDSDVIKRVYATRSQYFPHDVHALRPHPKLNFYEANPR